MVNYGGNNLRKKEAGFKEIELSQEEVTDLQMTDTEWISLKTTENHEEMVISDN